MTAPLAVGDPDPSLPDRALQRALVHAVRVAAVAARRQPPEPTPDGLRRYLTRTTLDGPALKAVRRVLVAEPEFRERVSAAASADLVDEVGRAWLAGVPGDPAGPADAAVAVATPSTPASTPASSGELRAEQRRRAAAESARDRAVAEAAAVRESAARDLAELGERVERLDRERARLERAQRTADERLASTSARADRLSRDLERVAADAERLVAEGETLREALARAESARDAALADRAQREGMAVDLDRLRRALADALAALGERAVSASDAPNAPGRPRRTPIGLPGGIRADSVAGVEHLLQVSGVLVVVDGYNVAKLGWPSRTLADQRDECIAVLESLAARWGTSITVVFDGAEVVGSSTRARRLVTVTYSPEGTTADDVIRQVVAVQPAQRPVVVVTNDRAIRDDVQRAGANPLSSGALLEAGR